MGLLGVEPRHGMRKLGGRSRTIRGARRRSKPGGVGANPTYTWISRKGVMTITNWHPLSTLYGVGGAFG